MINYRNNFFALIGLLFIILGGLLYFNISTIAFNNKSLQEIEQIQTHILESRSKIVDIRTIVKVYREKTTSLSYLATEYNSEIDYLSSLEILNTICSQHGIRIDEIMPRLENTLPQIQSVLTDSKHIIERYALDLRVDGRFLSLGKLLDELVDNDFIVRNLELKSKPSCSNITAIIGLYSYRLIAK